MFSDQAEMQNLPGENNATPFSSPLSNPGQRRSSPTSSLERGDLNASLEGMPSTSHHLASPFSASAFTNKPYSHLPTPQSPSNFGNYLRNTAHISESPVAHSYQTSSRVLSTPTTHRLLASNSEDRIVTQPLTQQIATPESSPFSRKSEHSYAPGPSRQGTSTPKGPSPLRVNHNIFHERSLLIRTNSSPRDAFNTFPLQPSSSTESSQSHTEGRSSQLSSPFMEKLSLKLPSTSSTPHNPTPIRSHHSRTPSLPTTDTRERSSSPTRDGNRSSFLTPNPSAPATPLQRTTQTPPTPKPHSQPQLPPSQQTPMKPPPGGELERIRQAMMRERMAHIQEAESRRPEYLKRSKRTFSETDPFGLEEEEALNQSSREREGLVGIMESPVKGRRLTLFQETSEESFEESLMAGGYGRYRTSDWVHHPHPTVLAMPGAPGPSSAVSALEDPQEAPPSDKELRKRRRLAAFTNKPSPSKAKLQPVHLEGRGRVLVDLAIEEDISAVAESTTGKKKASVARRKKKAAELEKRGHPDGVPGDTLLDKPNWPDSQFPWRVRLEEREEAEKEQEEEKLKWIGRFLDRDDSDEEDDEEIPLSLTNGLVEMDSLGESSSLPAPLKMGRGKMVPLATNPDVRPLARRHTMFPSDPADARTALLSKKSVRTLSYRQQKRQRRRPEGGGDDDDDEVVCVCRGTDDGRELVQCDGCEMWYHLECIGIRDISELGKEEDPWYCHVCEDTGRSPFVEQTEEPTFVPTDNTPSLKRSHDATFFQPSLQDSPMPWSSTRVPRTPNRGSLGHANDFYSDSSWIDSSGHGPRTPQQRSREARVYSGTPVFGSSYRRDSHDTPFDPTSTPSRGIKFGAPFATPKNSWSIRGSGPFQTPSRPTGRSSWNRVFGGPGTLASALDDDHGFYNHTFGNDESPIRRVKPNEAARARQFMDSPSAPRSLNTVSRSLFEESPIVRFQDVARRLEVPQTPERESVSFFYAE